MRWVILVSMLLSGCAGMTYGDSNNPWNLGYSDIQLNAKTYRVTYAGYNVPQSQCDEFALMRAAEITRARGLRYFKIVGQSQSNQASTVMLPSPAMTTGTINTVGNTAYLNATTTSYPIMGTIHRPVSSFTVEVLDSNQDQALDADIIWAALSKKHLGK